MKNSKLELDAAMVEVRRYKEFDVLQEVSDKLCRGQGIYRIQ
jgi:hypothetical protein